MGTGGIASRFAADLAHAPGARLAAVHARDAVKTGAFAGRTFGTPQAYGELAGFLTDPTVEIVYVATPNQTHAALALAALAAGKAVLIEKPLATSAADAERIASAAASRKLLRDGGDVDTVSAGGARRPRNWSMTARSARSPGSTAELSYCRDEAGDSRFFNPGLGGGAALDLGVYPISLALHLLGKPSQSPGAGERQRAASTCAANSTSNSPAPRLSFPAASTAMATTASSSRAAKACLRLDAPFLKAQSLMRFIGARAVGHFDAAAGSAAARQGD